MISSNDEDVALETYWKKIISDQISNKTLVLPKSVLQQILTLAKAWGRLNKIEQVISFRGYATAFNIDDETREVKRERYRIVKLLLDAKANCVNSTFNTNHNDSETLLQLAVKLRYPDIVKLLLDKGATFPKTLKGSFKMLLSAAIETNPNPIIFQMLIKHAMQIPQNEARCGHFLKEFIDIIKTPDYGKQNLLCLFQNGFRIPQDLKFRCSLVEKVIRAEKHEFLQIFFDNGLIIPSDEEASHVKNLSYTLILQAIRTNNSNVLDTLFKNGLGVSLKHEDQIELFKAAILTKNTDMVSLIMRKASGGEYDQKDFVPMAQNAFATKNVEMLEIMFNSFITLNYYKNVSVLLVQQIVDTADTGLIKTLIHRVANSPRFESIHYMVFQKAIESEDGELLQEMFKIKADINKVDENGVSLLHRAAKTRNTHIMQCLLDAGCSVDVVDEIQNPSLYKRIGKQTNDIMELLVAYKQHCGHASILQFAIMKDKLDIVKLLLSSERSRDGLNESIEPRCDCVELGPITKISREMVVYIIAQILTRN